jgi:hypothetical protein
MPWTDSDPVVVTLPIRGVWIHDPDNPEGTLRQYRYGANQRGDAFDAMQSGTYYVGREDPVFDYGDASGFSADITLDVYHGPDYTGTMIELRWFAAQKKSLWIRDNRSRAVFGSMSNFKTSDQPWGSSVSFTFTRAHRVVETVVI